MHCRTRRLVLTVFGLFLVTAAATATGQQSNGQPPQNTPLGINIGLLDKDWVGSPGYEKVAKADPLAQVRHQRSYCVLSYTWNGSNLQVHPLANKTADAIARDGWYLTGDYTTDPPRAILTEKATQHSGWEFLPLKDDPEAYYIININAPGRKTGYLTLKDIGHRAIREGTMDEVIFYDAVIQFEKPEKPFGVTDLKRNNGK